jgi:DNA-binding beta-propeller fold protein YncE
MVVVDTGSGRVVANLPIGMGNDAVAFDPVRKRVFSSNGRDGTISVYEEQSPDRYVALAPITTMVSARTMSVDPSNGWLFVPGAESDPPATPGARPKVRPGTLRVMIFAPRA